MKIALSPTLKLPPEAVTQTFAILAMRGVGKTYTASVFAEELSKACLPYAVLDPTGAWWGLRTSADGTGVGYPVTILGGDHGDLPLEEQAGKVIADLLAEEAPTLVLDLSHFSKSAMRRFVADFAEQLYRKNRNPLHLIIDEADAFAPQRPRPDEVRMLGALDEIVRRGRIRGLGCTLVTQRSAVLNKDVLTQTECLIVLRTAHPRDRAPVLEWMKVHASPEQLAEVETSLAKLPTGDAWVMSAGWLDLFRRIRIRERETFNSSATPTPGQRRFVPKKLAPVDLQMLQQRMAASIERAKATDPTLLQRRVAELEAKLQKLSTTSLAPARVERVEVPVLTDAHLTRVESVLTQALGAVELLQRLTDGLRVDLARAASSKVSTGMPARTSDVSRSEPAAPALPNAPRGNAEDGDEQLLSTYAQGLLRTLVERQPMKLTPGQLAVLSGRSARSSAFGGAVAKLRKRRLIADDANRLALTREGLAAAGTVQRSMPTTPAELQQAWLRVLPQYERDLLQVLFEAHPSAVTTEELSTKSGRSLASSAFSGALASLRRNGLIEGDRFQVRASESLFVATT